MGVAKINSGLLQSQIRVEKGRIGFLADPACTQRNMMLIRRLLLVLVFTISACVAQVQKPDDVLTFIHLNDIYRVDAVEEGRRGGMSRIASLVRDLKAAGNDVRILHGGDFLYPSLESQIWDGEQMVEAMNFLDDLAPLYAVPGNHEFDPREADELILRIRESRFDWLGDNIRLATGEPDVDQSMRTAFTFTSGDKLVGAFALTVLPEHGGNDRDHTPFIPGSYVEHAERVITELEEKGVDLIIGVTHLHLGDDMEVAKLKARHPKFMFIVGGHEHEPEYIEGSTDSAIIMKGASNARTVWQIDVTFGDNGPSVSEKTIAVDESIPLDPDYQVIADKWRTHLLEMMPFLPARVGDAAVPLDGREVAVRNGDSNWGIFIADQMRMAFRDPPADLAFVNGGTLRIDDFIAEDITFEDIGRTFGYSSYLRHMTMDGRDFRELLEAGYRGIGPSKGYFPQISGFRVCVDRSRPDGGRIVQMQVPAEAGDWQEIEADKAYSVIAPDYIYRGGDGYDFSAARDVSRPGSELIYLVLDAIISAQAGGEKVGQLLDPDDARFALLQGGQARCFAEGPTQP
jgi:2',3'-cyclic-nucleotide 2'-phosphodiesterase (5'-nucleotidase family)